MTKEQAARRLMLIAHVMRQAAFDDEGIQGWANDVETVAEGLDKRTVEKWAEPATPGPHDEGWVA